MTPRTLSVPLGRRIERRFAESNPQVVRATFSMGRGVDRVHVILQTNAGRATLIAICRPQVRSAVARALAQARRALASRGIVVDIRRDDAACS